MSGLTVRIEQQRPMRLLGGLRCASGQMVALVGPSGAGKTSLLRAVAGLMRPQRAHIAVDGVVWCDSERGLWVPPQARRVGLVFQHYALMPHMHALDNVALPLREPDRLQRAQAMLARVGLSPEQMRRRPAELSGGQQQRVAVARALVRQPSVLLLDEPFSSVDQMTRQSLYALLAELREDIAVPMLLVTHDLHEARLLADELVVMAEGEVLQQGRAQAIHQAPRNARVADIVGVANRFAGVWEGPDAHSPPGTGWLRWSDGPPGLRLCVRDKGRIERGQAVSWIVPGTGLTLHTGEDSAVPDAPAGTCVLPVRVQTVRHLGEVWLVQLRCADGPLFRLQLTGAPWQRLSPGQPGQLHMDLAAIHIMPSKPAPQLWPSAGA